jgi:hypothetical protein
MEKFVMFLPLDIASMSARMHSKNYVRICAKMHAIIRVRMHVVFGYCKNERKNG